MTRLLSLLSTGCTWCGVAVIARVWDTTPVFGLFATWQFYVAMVLFVASAALSEEVGKRRSRDRLIGDEICPFGHERRGQN